MNQEEGIRQTAPLMIIGVDATQGIALDELFGGKEEVRMTSRKTTTLIASEQNEQLIDEKIEKEEIVEVPTKTMRVTGLCRGKLCINLCAMMVLWSTTVMTYSLINLYLMYIDGNEFMN
jgi:hypothetical protein